MTIAKIKSIFGKNSETLTFMKGDKIYTPGTKVNEIYCIEHGSVKIGCYNEKGREITKFIFYQNEIFGEQSIAGLKKRRDYAFALEETKIQKIDISKLKEIAKTDKDLAWFFINLLGERNIALDERLESIVFKDSKTRIIDYLLKLIDKKGKKVGYEIVLRQFMTHQEIANLTSTSRQTVTTVLNILKNQGVITFDRHRLLVRDLEKLKGGIC